MQDRVYVVMIVNSRESHKVSHIQRNGSLEREIICDIVPDILIPLTLYDLACDF